MTHLDRCIEAVRKRALNLILNDINTDEKADIIVRAIAGLTALGEQSISRDIHTLTHELVATFAITSSYYALIIKRGSFANCLSTSAQVEEKREKAREGVKGVMDTIRHLKNIKKSIDQACESFPLCPDGDDEYAHMYARWHSMAEQVSRDIESQERLKSDLNEYKSSFNYHVDELAIIVNFIWKGLIEAGGGHIYPQARAG